MVKLKFLTIFALLGLFYFLSQVFSGRLILPQTFSLGSFELHYYGIFIALAVASGFYLAKQRGFLYGINFKIGDDIIFWLVVGGFIGARAYHIISSFSYYYSHPLDVFKIWNGGLSIYGAVLGGLVAVFLLCKKYDLEVSKVLDWLTPSLILGQIIGRFGNLFNYEAFGYATNLPWKMFVPENFRPMFQESFRFFHPWFLYEQVGLIIILCFILYIEKQQTSWALTKASFKHSQNQVLEEGKTRKESITFSESGRRGFNLFIFYFLLYNILRFGLEFLRVDSVFVYGYRQNAYMSLLIIFIILFILFKHKISHNESA